MVTMTMRKNQQQEFQGDGAFKSTTVTGGNQPIATITDKVPCTMSGSTIKKRSPSPLCLQEPTSKKVNFQPPSSDDHLPHGFIKLPLPVTLQSSSPSALRRTISEPINSLEAENEGSFLNSLSPENSKNSIPVTFPSPEKVTSASSSAFLPPLRRTISDPAPSAYEETTTTTNTLLPSLKLRASLQSPGLREKSIRAESPSAKLRLKRMEEHMKEMRTWWDQVIHEVEEDPGFEDNATNHHEQDVPEHGKEEPAEEAVWIERKGKCLIIHFKCPCGEGYEIVLSGNNCYYRLM